MSSISPVKTWLAVNNLSLVVKHGLEASFYQVLTREGSPVEWVSQGHTTPLSATVKTSIKPSKETVKHGPVEVPGVLLNMNWDPYETLRDQLVTGKPAVGKDGTQVVTPYLDINSSLAPLAYKNPELLPYVQRAEARLEATKHHTVQDLPETVLVGCLLHEEQYEHVTQLLASKSIMGSSLHSEALFWHVSGVTSSSKDPSVITKLTNFLTDPRNNEILQKSTASNRNLGVESAFSLMFRAGAPTQHAPAEAGTLVGTYLKAIGLAPAYVFQEANKLTRQSGFSLEPKKGFLSKLGFAKEDTELVSKEPTDKHLKALSNFPQTGYKAWGVSQATADLSVTALRRIYEDAVLTYKNTSPERSDFIESIR